MSMMMWMKAAMEMEMVIDMSEQGAIHIVEKEGAIAVIEELDQETFSDRLAEKIFNFPEG